jgi:hypothetical protein
MTLEPVEFIRRFLLHVLPSGFVKIRHFGLLANRNRRQAFALCRFHLNATASDITELLTEQQRSALNAPAPSADAEAALWPPASDFLGRSASPLHSSSIQYPYIPPR